MGRKIPTKDLNYVDNWSLGLDFQILIKTVKSVLLREGISAANHATMPKFTGELKSPEEED